LAAEELMKEAGRARVRAEIGGPTEWKKKPQKLNMKFVNNSILQTTTQNRRKLQNNTKKEQVE